MKFKTPLSYLPKIITRTITGITIIFVMVIVAFYPISSEARQLDRTPSNQLSLNIDSIFVNSPLSPLSILSDKARKDLVSNPPDSVKVLNSVYSLSTMTGYTDKSIRIHLTDVSLFSLNLVSNDNGRKPPIIVTIYTVGSEKGATDSDIEFYNTEWDQLDKRKLWEEPKVTDFLTKEKQSKTDLKQIADLIPFPTYELTLSEDGKTLTGRLTVDKYLSEEAKSEIHPYLIQERTWVWDGKKYKLNKIK